MLNRCAWAGTDPLYVSYHDTEWGVPVHDDRLLFEFLVLEGAQAGLSWITILRKRENYRAAFDHFDPQLVARYDEKRVAELLANPGIVRNRRKIEAAIQNARALLAVQEEFGSFDAYIWQFVGGKPLINAWTTMAQIPAETAESRAMSKDLIRRGFRFVGPTICYAHMQATGMVNDHTVDCFRYRELGGEWDRKAWIQQQVGEEQARLARVEARLRQIEQEDKMPSYEVVIKKIEPQTVASLREVIPVPQDVGKMFERLFTYLGQRGVRPVGPSCAIWHDTEYREKDLDTEVVVPIAEALPAGNGIKTVQLPGVASMACTVHQGSYEGFSQAYAALMEWIGANGYRIAGPIREIYLRGPGPEPTDPTTYVTEIQVPVEKV